MRDVISTEMWEALNSFYLLLGRYDLQAALRTGPYSVYQEVKERCALFWGLVDRTMLRDEGRAFLEAGGRIEEADMVLRMLRVAIPERLARRRATRPRRSRCCTRSAASRPTGARSAPRPTVGPVVRFLLFDSAYPGSVASSVDALSRGADGRRRPAALLAAGAAARSADRRSRAPAPRPGHPRSRSSEMLERVQDELELVDRDIDARYFAIAALAAVHL